MNPEFQIYINSFQSEQVRAKLNSLYKLLVELVPTEATQTIAYGIPTFKLNDKNLIHFGGAKNHVAIYPGAAAISRFQPELTKLNLQTSKGTIQFKLSEPLPKNLIQQIVRFLLNSQTQT
jgi:uncharacterized protein YdhG (YjbR/CyaY superfamily)